MEKILGAKRNVFDPFSPLFFAFSNRFERESGGVFKNQDRFPQTDPLWKITRSTKHKIKIIRT